MRQLHFSSRATDSGQDQRKGITATVELMRLAECRSSDRLSTKVLDIKGQRSGDPQPSLVAAGVQQQVVGMWMESAISKTKSVEKLNVLLERLRVGAQNLELVVSCVCFRNVQRNFLVMN